MKELISKKYAHLLWQDELGDDFLLLDYAEVYQCSENVLRLLIFQHKKGLLLKDLGVIFNEWETDDGLLTMDIEKQNLTSIIELGNFKRRPDINGKWIKDKEKKLAHRIIPFCPKLNETGI